MRIAVVELQGKGGLLHYDYHLCRALQRLGVETTLVTSTVYELHNLDHNFRVVPLMRLWDPRGSKSRNPAYRLARRIVRGGRYVLEWLRLVKYLRREKPDIIVFGKIHFSFEYYFLRMLRSFGLKLADIVHDVRNYDTREKSGAIVNDSPKEIAQFNRIYSQFSALFVHDRINYDLFLSLYDVPATHVHEIPMATNELILELPPDRTSDQLRQELGIQPGQCVVTFLGTLSKYKGVETLIRAFPAVQQSTGARLVIAGFPAKDVDPETLKALAADLGVAEHISWFLDYVPNERVRPYMAISDVVVFPYHMISQSAAIQLAYACGKPVVASRVGGLPDIVEEEQNGLLVPPQDENALAEAITRVLQDPELAEKMGTHSKMLAETRYSWKNVAERMKAVFEDVQANLEK